MNENFNTWTERLARDPKHSKPLSEGEVVQSSAAEPFLPIDFVKISKPNLAAEVGKRGKHYIFHFYADYKKFSPETFRAHIEAGFDQVFTGQGEAEFAFSEELKSWAVRLSGWSEHIWGDELAARVVDVISERLPQ